MTLSVERGVIETLAGEWDALGKRARTDNVFVGWSFLATWWEQFGAERELQLFVVRDAGRIIAIVPLCIVEQRGRLGTIRSLVNLGSGAVVNPDFLDALVWTGREQEVASVLAPEIASLRFDLADFGELGEESSLGLIAQAWQQRLGGALLREPKARCPYIALPDSFETFMMQRNSHFRQQLRRYRRVIERELKVEWRRAGIDLPLDIAIEELTRLHQQRMEATARGGNFKKEQYRLFQQRLAERLSERGELYFWVLYSDDLAIATHYGFLHDGIYYGYQMGFDPTFAKHSPGHYMTGVVVEKLIALGAREMNLLRGTDSWKYRWTELERQTWTVRWIRPGLAARRAYLSLQLSQSPALIARWLLGRELFDELRRAWLGRREAS